MSVVYVMLERSEASFYLNCVVFNVFSPPSLALLAPPPLTV